METENVEFDEDTERSQNFRDSIALHDESPKVTKRSSWKQDKIIQ